VVTVQIPLRWLSRTDHGSHPFRSSAPFIEPARRAVTTAPSPRKLVEALRAQWQLRTCDSVPLTVTVEGRVFVRNEGRIDIGDRVRFEASIVPTQLSTGVGAKLSIGPMTYLNYGVSVGAEQEVLIGANCLIGQYTLIMDSDYHDVATRAMPGPVAPVIIEDNVWLAARVVVLKGVRIGRGSVVGVGSVVTRDIPAGCLAVGSPARVIRHL
jgi:acetyltransferase-like isoleucine patch superfamily enzyme